jgi:PEP-CTERM motif
MKRSGLAALGAAVITTFAASSAARAVTINFGFAAGDGSKTYTGTSLQESSALDLDGATMLVLGIGSGDASGLAFGDVINLGNTLPPSATHIISYGDPTVPVPPGGRPLGFDVILTWPISPAPGADVFTETLTTVVSINRAMADQIGVTMTGTITDTTGLFSASDPTPVELIMTASQAGGGPGGDFIGVEFTNKSFEAPPTSIPEPSTWVMMGLGFGALGYAASRQRKANAALRSI